MMCEDCQDTGVIDDNVCDCVLAVIEREKDNLCLTIY